MHVTAKTDIGLAREENEDTVYVSNLDEEASLAILCDGMGGMNAGEIASRIAAEEISTRITSAYRNSSHGNSLRNLIVSAINGANVVIFKKAEEEQEKAGMGTTCVCGVIRNNLACIANVGDSRAYLICNDGISQITTDHTIVKMLVDQGKINEDEAKVHPQKNIITRAVGIEDKIDIDYYEVELKQNSKVLFCSDGLSGYCDKDTIFSVVNEYESSVAEEKLIEIAKNNGSKDNITVAIVCN